MELTLTKAEKLPPPKQFWKDPLIKSALLENTELGLSHKLNLYREERFVSCYGEYKYFSYSLI